MNTPEEQNERSALAELDTLKAKYAAQRSGEQMSVGPFGKMLPVKRQFISQSFGFKDPSIHLSQPELLIKDPEPGYHYAWPRADDDATRGKLRDGHYIKVHLNECHPQTGLTISTHKGTSNGADVRWYSHVLVKIPPAAWEELYEEPAERSKYRLMQEAESFQDNVVSASKGVARPSVEIGVETGQN